MDFLALLSTIGTLFLLLVCGFVCRKVKIIDDVMSKKLSAIVVNVGQPFLLISSLTKQEYSPENVKTGFLILVLGFGVHAFIAVLAFLLGAPIKDLDERKITQFALVFANCAFIGFPIAKALLGDIGLFYGAFYVMSFNILLWTLGIFIIGQKRSDIKLTPKKIFLNFGTVPCCIGFVIFATGIRLPVFLTDFMSYLGGICTPLTMLITGALLATRTPKQIFGSGKIYYLSVAKLIIIPVIVCLVARLVGLPDYMVIFATVMASMPSGAIATMFGELYDVSPGYASQAVGTTTVLSSVTLPFVMWFCQWVVSL